MKRRFLGVWALVSVLGCGAGLQTTIDADDVPELVGVWYTVEPGDSVSAISTRYGVPVEDIVELNGLAQPDRLEAGQELFLFGIDELIRRLPPKTAPTPPSPTPAAARRFIWPIAGGTLTSRFGKRGRRQHKGIDIGVNPGTPVLAAAAGEVIYSDNKQRGYGNLVILRHADNYVTVYAHNRRNLVDEGDTVGQGTRIAEVGSTGRSTGPHLHFEIRKANKAVDPLKYLPVR